MLAFTRHWRRRSPLARYGLAVVAVLLAFAIEAGIARTVGFRYLFVAFAPAVAFSAWYGGFGPGAVAVLLSLVLTARFLAAPGTLFRLETAGDVAAVATFAACWLAVGLLAESVFRRLQREGEWRIEAERIAGQADRLERFTAAMGKATTVAEACEACVQEALYALSADAGGLLTVEDDGEQADLMRAVGYAPELVERWKRLPLTTVSPISEAARNRVPVVLESREERVTQYPAADDLYAAAHQASIAVPLVAGRHLVAVLRLDYNGPRAFDSDDRQFVQSIAPRAAMALDRAANYEAAQRARAEAERERGRADEQLAERQRIEEALRASETRNRSLAARTARLRDLSAAMSGAVTLDAVARAMVQHGRVAVGAVSGSVALLVEQGTEFETRYSDDQTTETSRPGYRFAKASGLCATAAVDTAAPVFISSFKEWQERYALSASLAADGGYASSVTLPLLVEGAPVAVLEFHFTVPVNFDDEYRALLVSVAQHCAQALDRARLYESAQQARTEAEAANRLKDEFLSVVSHELRTPLNSILGWANILKKGELDASRTVRALQAIEDNASRQATLVDELLDFSRIVAGRVTLDSQNLDLTSLLNGVVESVVPVAAAKGVALDANFSPGIAVVGDVRRLEQVFFNLLGNAVKFTPEGGRVSVQAASGESQIEVSVTDTGVGIEPAFLPHVFDRFRQADSTVSRNFGGLGLGLSIAKQMVEAHKGTIAVESAGAGKGCRFTVRLPLAAGS